ncbi:MAG TPA: hypothetical protein VGK73_02850, partial [Polyangiaceae bacterium]
MKLGEKTWRHLAFATLLAAGSWLGCSPSDDRTPDEGTVGTTRQALEPCAPWTPSCLAPLAWYVADT